MFEDHVGCNLKERGESDSSASALSSTRSPAVIAASVSPLTGQLGQKRLSAKKTFSGGFS
jgi:hypothetical protein